MKLNLQKVLKMYGDQHAGAMPNSRLVEATTCVAQQVEQVPDAELSDEYFKQRVETLRTRATDQKNPDLFLQMSIWLTAWAAFQGKSVTKCMDKVDEKMGIRDLALAAVDLHRRIGCFEKTMELAVDSGQIGLMLITEEQASAACANMMQGPSTPQ